MSKNRNDKLRRVGQEWSEHCFGGKIGIFDGDRSTLEGCSQSIEWHSWLL
jgi:hypothetical protein